MMQMLLIGIGAGAASALLFASVASGSLFSVFLFYLAPLPILIAATGWSHWSALIAAVSAAAALAAAFDVLFLFTFLAGVGLPAWWLGYLALLARPTGQPAPHDTEWYPPGRLVVWAALLGALIVVIAIPNFGLDAESFKSALRATFERLLRLQTQTPADKLVEMPSVNSDRLLDLLVLTVPPAAAVVATATNAVNLWLAGRVVAVSGRLSRPWPDLAAMTFPAFAPALLAAMVAGSFLPNIVGIVCGIFTASLLMAYALLGLAVLHAITRGVGGRGVILSVTYLTVALFGWPVLLMTLLGLADTAFEIRTRVARKRGPPAPRAE
jgi:hypothetical protein